MKHSQPLLAGATIAVVTSHLWLAAVLLLAWRMTAYTTRRYNYFEGPNR